MKLIMGGVFGLLLISASAEQTSKAEDRRSGVVVLDKDGWGMVRLPDVYLDSHLCTAGDSFDEITISFTTKYFTISEGKPDQHISWACVPLNGKVP